jgi:NADH dehydrogenase [ubiquinone] 1 alpha subcomplex assembly factor 7
VAQGMFLAELGLFQRINRLAMGRAPAEAFALRQAAARLAEPAAMGRLFKVMAVRAVGAPLLAGFG